MKQHVCKCALCRKRLKDPKDNPVYVVTLDKYFCDDKCWNKYRKSEYGQRRRPAGKEGAEAVGVEYACPFLMKGENNV